MAIISIKITLIEKAEIERVLSYCITKNWGNFEIQRELLNRFGTTINYNRNKKSLRLKEDKQWKTKKKKN